MQTNSLLAILLMNIAIFMMALRDLYKHKEPRVARVLIGIFVLANLWAFLVMSHG